MVVPTSIFLRLFISLVCLLLYLCLSNDFLIGLAFVILFMNFDNILVLKNFFLAYNILMFGVAGDNFFPDDFQRYWVMGINVLIFCIGYESVNKRSQQVAVRVENFSVVAGNRLEICLCLILCLKFAVMLFDLWRFGIANYFAGMSLVFDVQFYGQQDFWIGLIGVIKHILNIGSVAVSTLYVYVAHFTNRKLNRFLLAGVLVIAPIFLLQRANVAVGTVYYMMLMTFFEHDKSKQYKVLLVSILVILTVGVGIGTMRDSVWLADRQKSVTDSALYMINGEFNTIIAYTEIQDHIDTLHYQYGRTLIMPLLFKLAPSAWMPDKPENSSAYFMWLMHPNSASAGFFIAPSVFGDVFLNFGGAGIVIFNFLLGWLTGRLDACFNRPVSTGTMVFFIVYFWYYSLLRNNLSDTLAMVLLTMIVSAFVHQMIVKIPKVRT